MNEPLMDLALLHRATETVGLISYGGGVKWHLAKHWWVRIDLHDYVTPFPAQLISAASGLRVNDWLHDLVPTLGALTLRDRGAEHPRRAPEGEAPAAAARTRR